jgi:hypothetical protein
VSTGNTNAADLALALLAAVQNAFATASPPVPLPDRQFATGTTIAEDCEQLVVAFDSIFTGTPGQAATPQFIRPSSTRVATFTVQINRLIPSLEGVGQGTMAPSAADIQASGIDLMTDAFLMHRGLMTAANARAFGDPKGVSLGPVTPTPAAGEIGGMTMIVTIDLT